MEYSSCDFERIVNSQWILSPREQWTRIQMYVMDGVLYFAKLIVFGRDTYVIITVLLFRRILMVGAIKLSFLIVYMLKAKLLEDLRLRHLKLKSSHLHSFRISGNYSA